MRVPWQLGLIVIWAFGFPLALASGDNEQKGNREKAKVVDLGLWHGTIQRVYPKSKELWIEVVRWHPALRELFVPTHARPSGLQWTVTYDKTTGQVLGISPPRVDWQPRGYVAGHRWEWVRTTKSGKLHWMESPRIRRLPDPLYDPRTRRFRLPSAFKDPDDPDCKLPGEKAEATELKPKQSVQVRILLDPFFREFQTDFILILPLAETYNAPAHTAAREELKRLAGKWEATAIVYDGKEEELATNARRFLIFEANGRFLIGNAKERQEKGTFLIGGRQANPSNAVDVLPETGPHKGQTIRALYHLDGDSLQVCSPMAPNKPRPDSVASQPDSGLYRMTYKRVKAR